MATSSEPGRSAAAVRAPPGHPIIYIWAFVYLIVSKAIPLVSLPPSSSSSASSSSSSSPSHALADDCPNFRTEFRPRSQDIRSAFGRGFSLEADFGNHAARSLLFVAAVRRRRYDR